MPIEILDSWAILAFLLDEPAAKNVESKLEEASDHKLELIMSAINVGEIFYSLIRKGHVHDAEQWKLDIRSFPVRIHVPTMQDIFSASALKSANRISYADAFAASLAIEKNAPLITGDPEFKMIEDLKLIWLGKS